MPLNTIQEILEMDAGETLRAEIAREHSQPSRRATIRQRRPLDDAIEDGAIPLEHPVIRPDVVCIAHLHVR